MKSKIKLALLITILFLGGVAAVMGVKVARTYFSGAAAGTAPQNVRILADKTSATITWQTDKNAMGVVEYGANQASLLLRALENTPTTSHRVVLSPLKPGTVYYFRIRVGDEVYDNNGLPYSFRTKSAAAAVSPTVAVTPVPTVAISPTAPTASSSGSLVTVCQAADFKKQFGGHNPAYDFDKNGVVNTQDWLLCLQKNKK